MRSVMTVAWTTSASVPISEPARSHASIEPTDQDGQQHAQLVTRATIDRGSSGLPVGSVRDVAAQIPITSVTADNCGMPATSPRG